MATVNMQIKLYTLPSQPSIVYNDGFCDDDPVRCAYTEPPWAIYKLDTAVSTM